MKRIAIKNWIGSQQIEVSSDEDTVSIRQAEGSMSFLFFMTPEQAQELSDALLMHASQFEPDMPLE